MVVVGESEVSADREGRSGAGAPLPCPGCGEAQGGDALVAISAAVDAFGRLSPAVHACCAFKARRGAPFFLLPPNPPLCCSVVCFAMVWFASNLLAADDVKADRNHRLRLATLCEISLHRLPDQQWRG